MMPTSLSEVLKWHKSVFEEGLGKLKGHETKIDVDSSAQPQFCKARSALLLHFSFFIIYSLVIIVVIDHLCIIGKRNFFVGKNFLAESIF